jgi:hypothetical protein
VSQNVFSIHENKCSWNTFCIRSSPSASHSMVGELFLC